MQCVWCPGGEGTHYLTCLWLPPSLDKGLAAKHHPVDHAERVFLLIPSDRALVASRKTGNHHFLGSAFKGLLILNACDYHIL